jgi:hypothetical protein
LVYLFGDNAIEQQFDEFSDTVSTQYGVPDLCKLSYFVNLTPDASNFGVSILKNGSSYYIKVLTIDP